MFYEKKFFSQKNENKMKQKNPLSHNVVSETFANYEDNTHRGR